MNLRQAAEMALKYFEDAHGRDRPTDTVGNVKLAGLRQALSRNQRRSGLTKAAFY
jgi:hypothetical protein